MLHRKALTIAFFSLHRQQMIKLMPRSRLASVQETYSITESSLYKRLILSLNHLGKNRPAIAASGAFLSFSSVVFLPQERHLSGHNPTDKWKRSVQHSTGNSSKIRCQIRIRSGPLDIIILPKPREQQLEGEERSQRRVFPFIRGDGTRLSLDDISITINSRGGSFFAFL